MPLQDGTVPRTYVAIATAPMLRSGQVADAGWTDMAGEGGLFALDYVQPGIELQTLDAGAAGFEELGPGFGGPVILGRNTVHEVEATVDEVGRRIHGLGLFDQFLVGRVQSRTSRSVFDGHLDPLF